MTRPTYFDGEQLRDPETGMALRMRDFAAERQAAHEHRWDVVMSPERFDGFRKGVEAAIAIIEERGKRIRGAIQPDLTVKEIRERLLP